MPFRSREWSFSDPDVSRLTAVDIAFSSTRGLQGEDNG